MTERAGVRESQREREEEMGRQRDQESARVPLCAYPCPNTEADILLKQEGSVGMI